ncbi:MAG: UrcA family protein [Croceibacterium sp.]
MRRSTISVLAAVLFSGIAATPALAADEVSVSVSYADLDLTAPAGTAVLGRRIDAAVATVCEKPSLRDLKGTIAWEACKASAHASAVEQISILEPYQSFALNSMF